MSYWSCFQEWNKQYMHDPDFSPRFQVSKLAKNITFADSAQNCGGFNEVTQWGKTNCYSLAGQGALWRKTSCRPQECFQNSIIVPYQNHVILKQRFILICSHESTKAMNLFKLWLKCKSWYRAYALTVLRGNLYRVPTVLVILVKHLLFPI